MAEGLAIDLCQRANNDSSSTHIVHFAGYKEEVIYILPENEIIFKCFSDLLTQFTYVNEYYLSGLTYSNVYSYLKIKHKYQMEEIFDGIRICEVAFINKFNSELSILLEKKRND